MKHKPFQIFAEIRRVDEEKREVEAYAFVNEVVQGEGGLRLKRSAMEAATPGYMEWANVREMHQPSAVATARTVVWDDKGAQMVLRVVDDQAWAKVKEGVYKGLSVGVRADVMRGKDVEKCTWYETSLVDRPKDPGAKILAFRAEGFGDEDEFDAEELPETPADGWFGRLLETAGAAGPAVTREDLEEYLERAMTSAEVPARENLEGKPKKVAIYDCGISYHRHTTDGGAQECMASQAEQAEDQIAYYEARIKELKKKRAEEAGDDGIQRVEIAFDLAAPEAEQAVIAVRRGEEVVSEIDAETLSRLLSLDEDTAQLIQRAETAEAETVTVRAELAEKTAELATATERITALEAEPASKPPVRYPAALERTFAANEDDPNVRRAVAAREKLAELQEQASKEHDPAKRHEIARQMIVEQAKAAV